MAPGAGGASAAKAGPLKANMETPSKRKKKIVVENFLTSYLLAD